MNKPLAFLVLLVLLIILNVAVGSDVVGNFLLGILSALIALATRRYFQSDVTSLAATILFGVALAPYFGYLLWYAAIGARTVPAQVATNWLVDYVNANFLASIPSTIAGAIGGSLIDKST